MGGVILHRATSKSLYKLIYLHYSRIFPGSTKEGYLKIIFYLYIFKKVNKLLYYTLYLFLLYKKGLSYYLNFI